MKAVCASWPNARYTLPYERCLLQNSYFVIEKHFTSFTKNVLRTLKYFTLLVAKTKKNRMWLWRRVWAHWPAAPYLAIQAVYLCTSRLDQVFAGLRHIWLQCARYKPVNVPSHTFKTIDISRCCWCHWHTSQKEKLDDIRALSHLPWSVPTFRLF